MFSKLVIFVLALTLVSLFGYLAYLQMGGKNHFKKESLQNLPKEANLGPIGQPFSRGLLTITFDDGHESQLTMAVGQLEKHKFGATYYLSTGLLNTKGYLTDDQVKSLKAKGFHIADHTISHPHLITLPLVDVERELSESKKYLQSKFGVSAEDFASPYGEVNEQVLGVVKKHFKNHRGVLSGYNYKDNFDVYNIKVQNVLLTTTAAEVEQWVKNAQTNKAWLLLVYHQIDNGGDKYSATPDNFEKQIDVIAKSKIDVLGFDKALAEILPQIAK